MYVIIILSNLDCAIKVLLIVIIMGADVIMVTAYDCEICQSGLLLTAEMPAPKELVQVAVEKGWQYIYRYIEDVHQCNGVHAYVPL
jgi:hypothetical protein